MHQPIITLSPLEVESFPINQQELNNILVKEEDKFNQALQKFTTIKRNLFAKNGNKFDNWPEVDQNLYLDEVAKIDAITAETIDYIRRLTSEVTQIPD
jgi:hypothetical protein